MSHLSDEMNRMLEELEKSEEKFRAVSSAAKDAIIMMDDNGDVTYWNKAAEKIFGYKEDEVIGKELHVVLVPPGYHEAFRKGMETFRATGKGQAVGRTIELTGLRKGGIEFPIELSLSSVKLNEKWNAIGIVRDITKRKQIEWMLKESEIKYRRFVENLRQEHFFYRHNTDGVFTYLSPSITDVLGYSQEEFLTHFTEYLTDNPINKEVIHHTELSIKGIQQPPYEVEIYHKDGSIHRLEVSEFPVLDNKGNVVGVEGLAHDVTERKRMEEKLQVMSLHDELTGLLNRRGFMTLAEQQLRIAERMKRCMLLLFADLDGLKWINDNLGHKEGDLALSDIAKLLKETFRESDIIARIGGDEFVILVMEAYDESAEILTARLNANIDNYNARGERRYRLSLSVGITHYDPDNPCSLDELLSQADKMMYEQKQKKH
ncbi:MAG: sensor domain-containing diguanylate cyclase [Nitrospira sp.]|nr:sensor domain-containing diguanylate cyclase [Nitrospira sp.]